MPDTTAGCVIVVVATERQPLVSDAETLITPAVKFEMFGVVAPLLHRYVYPGFPPLAVTEADALLPPLHKRFVPEIVVVIAEGSVIVWVFEILQPLASVIVTE